MNKNLCSLLFLASSITSLGAISAAAQPTANGELFTTAQEEYDGPLNILLSTRMDYQREYLSGDPMKDNCGFKGKYLMFSLNGNINNKFSYTYRQRLNELHHNNSFFDGTDVMNLKYKFNDKFDITGGKMGMYFGSWEYERNPLYIYDYSEWTNHISCYKFGVSIGFNASKDDRIIAQITESPFNKRVILPATEDTPEQKVNDLYAYNIAWYGNHNWLHTIYSANVLEYNPGKFIYYLCLGHRLDFGKVAMEIDYMNRATEKHTFFFKNCSVIGEVSVAPNCHWNIFAKGAYTVNNTNDPSDLCVFAGTELTQISGGCEFFPLKNGNKSLRIHANYGYHFGNNTNPAGVMLDKQQIMSIGLQWEMDMVDLVKKVWQRTKK